ncbi:MAG: type II secretion system protein [Planctomycetota bacterium]
MRKNGFTLIEILIVMAIISLLMGAFIFSQRTFFGAGKKTKTTGILHEVETMIEQYQRHKGDYPPSTLDALDLKTDNDVNEGIEACMASLFDTKYQGELKPDERNLENTDHDSADRDFSVMGSRQLFEVVDSEHSPFVYIHNRDYGKAVTYLIMDPKSGDYVQRTVTAYRSKKTGGYANFDSYQLWSAGPDGKFQTDDDVANFEIEPDEAP